MVDEKLRGVHLPVAGVRMHARVGGRQDAESPPVVLLHGLSISSRYMMPLAREVARWSLVHAVDLPGFGLSGNPPAILGIPELTDATAAWIDANDLAPAIVLGNSVGSQIAVDLAARYPDRVAGIVLTGLALGGQRRGVLSQAARALIDAPREPLSLWPMQARDFIRAGPLRVLRTFRLAYDDGMSDAVALVSAPTLVVQGTRDPLDDPEWNRSLVDRLANGRLAVVPGGTHALPMSRPIILAALLREFAFGLATGALGAKASGRAPIATAG